ncbi:hypothetical protein FOQG_00930 [Fusarium oxysporum f. sp. raphani 54005]|uniref:Uncharacterized protein n=2 Tax=Fusarium oxysporum TaxID=5507 RepID=X0DD62_FUSOX|nr:hypothetical protein FOVG_02651 [Fusarium oxysporum f. sp. pisi HDV247]EXL01055.1 hypothetical protein FOQG_00930 [Fusarium oxysporum f. sp. raphani 54005]
MNHSPQSKEKIYRAKGVCIGGVGVALPRFRTPLTGLTGTASGEYGVNAGYMR